MAVLDITNLQTERRWHTWHNSAYQYATDETFILVWQLARTLDDVEDTLAAHGCRHARTNADAFRSSLQNRAKSFRGKGIDLQTLRPEGEETRRERINRLKSLAHSVAKDPNAFLKATDNPVLVISEHRV